MLRSSFGNTGTLAVKEVDVRLKTAIFAKFPAAVICTVALFNTDRRSRSCSTTYRSACATSPRPGDSTDAALKPLGYTCLNEAPGSLGYGREAVALWISTAERPVPADDKSGLHFCFDAPTRKSVAAFHAAGVKSGGHDNGKPGLREDYGANYYAAFVIDPDGYRLEAYCGVDA